MAASVSAKYRFQLTVTDQPAAGLDLATDVPYTHEITHTLTTLDGTTTPAVTKSFSDTVALSAGAVSLDLTSLAGPNSTTIDFTGLKIQIFEMSCPDTNTGVISMTNGAANPYDIYGAAGGIVSLVPGGRIMCYTDDELEDVDGTHKQLDFAGTGVETFSIILTAG